MRFYALQGLWSLEAVNNATVIHLDDSRRFTSILELLIDGLHSIDSRDVELRPCAKTLLTQ